MPTIPEKGDAFPLDRAQLGHDLRTYAYQLADTQDLGPNSRAVIDTLWQMADHVDGGVGDLVHHGCPDTTIPTRTCSECHMVVDVEVRNGGRAATIFGALGDPT